MAAAAPPTHPHSNLDVARADLAACVLGSSMAASLVAAAVSVPVCLQRKSYAPLFVLVAAGTGVDMAVGLSRCTGKGRAAAAAAKEKGGGEERC